MRLSTPPTSFVYFGRIFSSIVLYSVVSKYYLQPQVRNVFSIHASAYTLGYSAPPSTYDNIRSKHQLNRIPHGNIVRRYHVCTQCSFIQVMTDYHISREMTRINGKGQPPHNRLCISPVSHLTPSKTFQFRP